MSKEKHRHIQLENESLTQLIELFECYGSRENHVVDITTIDNRFYSVYVDYKKGNAEIRNSIRNKLVEIFEKIEKSKASNDNVALLALFTAIFYLKINKEADNGSSTIAKIRAAAFYLYAKNKTQRLETLVKKINVLSTILCKYTFYANQTIGLYAEAFFNGESDLPSLEITCCSFSKLIVGEISILERMDSSHNLSLLALLKLDDSLVEQKYAEISISTFSM